MLDRTMLDRISQLPICRFVSYIGTGLSYSNFHEVAGDVTPADYIMPDLLTGSDYSGTTVEKANYRAFVKRYNSGVSRLSGGYNTFAVVISISWLLENPDEADDILNTLEALDDYPVVDEDELTLYEVELIQEGWESWARHDYLRGLDRKFGDVDLTDDEAFELFNKVAARIGEDWCADSNDMTIDVDKVVAATTREDVCSTS